MLQLSVLLPVDAHQVEEPKVVLAHTLGRACQALEQFEKAHRYLDLALACSGAEGEHSAAAVALLSSKAECFSRQGQLDQCILVLIQVRRGGGEVDVVCIAVLL